MKQIWRTTRKVHDQLTAPVWRAGWTVPLAVLVFAISIPFWRLVISEAKQTLAEQIDYDNSALCIKFGFSVDTEKHVACKLDLLDLRRSHEKLIAATSFP